MVTPAAKRQAIEVLAAAHRLPIQRACHIVRRSRAAYYRPPVPASRRDAAVIVALMNVVVRYPRWGFWKGGHNVVLTDNALVLKSLTESERMLLQMELNGRQKNVTVGVLLALLLG